MDVKSRGLVLSKPNCSKNKGIVKFVDLAKSSKPVNEFSELTGGDEGSNPSRSTLKSP